MTSVRDSIGASWFPETTLIQRGMVPALALSEPLSVRELVRLLEQPEELRFDVPLDQEGLHGEVHLVIRSDGTYRFNGDMRATGAISFAYKVQVSLKSGAGIYLFLESSGHAYGSDTSGDRQHNWSEEHISSYVKQLWTMIRLAPQVDTHLETNIAGTLGAVVDVAKTVVETFVALQLAGPVAAVLVLGSELGAATGQTFTNPDLLLGALVAGGTIVLLGPGVMIPAIAAGAGAVAIADIRFRRMTEPEVALARRVFGDKVPVDRIIVTDLFNPGDNDVDREFVIPGLDGSILVNMGRNYDATLDPDAQQAKRKGAYPKPGQVFIHELTHAWQVQYASFMPGFVCRGVFGDKEYNPVQEKIDAGAPWFPTFGVEQQASIIDRWYGAYVGTGLESPPALQDPRFRYVSQNIRLGQA